MHAAPSGDRDRRRPQRHGRHAARRPATPAQLEQSRLPHRRHRLDTRARPRRPASSTPPARRPPPRRVARGRARARSWSRPRSVHRVTLVLGTDGDQVTGLTQAVATTRPTGSTAPRPRTRASRASTSASTERRRPRRDGPERLSTSPRSCRVTSADHGPELGRRGAGGTAGCPPLPPELDPRGRRRHHRHLPGAKGALHSGGIILRDPRRRCCRCCSSSTSATCGRPCAG